MEHFIKKNRQLNLGKTGILSDPCIIILDSSSIHRIFIQIDVRNASNECFKAFEMK